MSPDLLRRSPRSRPARRTAAAAGALLIGSGLIIAAAQANAAAAGCKVNYTADQWATGFTANLIVTNLGDAITGGWKLEWDYAGNQTVTQSWNSTSTQNGKHVTLTNAAWNASLPTNGTANPGLNANYSGANAAPTSFKLNGVTCTGGTAPTPSASTSQSPSPSASPSSSPSSTPSPSASSSAPNPPAGNALYVSPDGNASAAGTVSSPTTLASAIPRITAGGTIYLRGGVYNFSQTVLIAPGNDGTSSARKRLSAYAGETPVLNFSAMSEDPANRGLALNGSYWHIYGIVVERAGDNGIFVGGSNNIIERTVTRYNHDSGLQISRTAADTPRAQWPANNLVLSAESHDNADSDGEDADGFAAKLTSGPGNVFRYTVSHNNIDDGWDLFAKPDTGPIDPVTIEDSLSYNNGTLSNGTQNTNGDRNGYKLGGSDIKVNHIVRRSVAYHNGKHGFTYNSNPGTMAVSNNISIDNGTRNFSFDAGTSVFRNNVSCRSSSGSNDKTIGDVDTSNQFWVGSNGSRCSSYTGALGWSIATDGRLVVTFGGKPVTP
jgi:hypothetical protein